jgi:hypothetical protein
MVLAEMLELEDRIGESGVRLVDVELFGLRMDNARCCALPMEDKRCALPMGGAIGEIDETGREPQSWALKMRIGNDESDNFETQRLGSGERVDLEMQQPSHDEKVDLETQQSSALTMVGESDESAETSP